VLGSFFCAEGIVVSDPYFSDKWGFRLRYLYSGGLRLVLFYAPCFLIMWCSLLKSIKRKNK